MSEHEQIVGQNSQHPERKSTKDIQWESVEIGGETFLAIRGFTNEVSLKNGRDVDFNVDIYRHLETGMEITVHSLGMNQPKEVPAMIRADYTCPCMNYPVNWSMKHGHDCNQQRDLAFETIAEVGSGIMAIVSEQTAAGNGHGPQAVYKQATMQYEAEQRGEHIPTTDEAYSEMGYFNDIRRHDIVAKVIASTLDGREAIPATSNIGKLQQFEEAGINLYPDARVELVTDLLSSRIQNIRRDGYNHYEGAIAQGAYLIKNGESKPLNRETYVSLAARPISQRRITARVIN